MPQGLEEGIDEIECRKCHQMTGVAYDEQRDGKAVEKNKEAS